MKPGLVFIAIAALSACAPAVPDNSSGLYRSQPARDMALESGAPAIPQTNLPLGQSAPVPSVETTPLTGGTTAAQTAADTSRILAETRAQADDVATATDGLEAPQPLASSPAEAPNNPAISQENDFDVVSSRETIESDAARIAQNRAQYVVVEPEALPTRPGSDQPNVVAFALATSHPVGTALYARAGLNGASRAARNCADYPSPDQAQIDFLERGGPERDRRGLDPDGDGYACAWDPSPFRKAAGD